MKPDPSKLEDQREQSPSTGNTAAASSVGHFRRQIRRQFSTNFRELQARQAQEDRQILRELATGGLLGIVGVHDSGGLQRYEVEDMLLIRGEEGLKKLYSRIRKMFRHYPAVDAEDLVQEAIARLLEGRRVWKDSFSFDAAITGITLSLLGDATRGRPVEVPLDDAGTDADEAALELLLRDENVDPERTLEPGWVWNSTLGIHIRFSEVAELFTPYPNCLRILKAMSTGLAASDVQRSFKLTPAGYASAWRQITRVLQRHRLRPARLAETRGRERRPPKISQLPIAASSADSD